MFRSTQNSVSVLETGAKTRVKHIGEGFAQARGGKIPTPTLLGDRRKASVLCIYSTTGKYTPSAKKSPLLTHAQRFVLCGNNAFRRVHQPRGLITVQSLLGTKKTVPPTLPLNLHSTRDPSGCYSLQRNHQSPKADTTARKLSLSLQASQS